MKKHFVVFCSPGSFVSEQTTKEIDSWDIDKAKRMAEDIKERYNATPYGFYFITKCRSDDELDSKKMAKSNMYYLGGEVQTLDEIKARNNPNDRILISNMEINEWDKVIVNTNSWIFTAPLNENDIVLEWP